MADHNKMFDPYTSVSHANTSSDLNSCSSPNINSSDNSINCERGIALVIVIFALLLIGLLGATMLLSTLSNELDSADLESERMAYSYAEMGAMAAIDILRGHGGPNNVNNSINLYIALTDTPDADKIPRLSRWLPYKNVKRLTRARSYRNETFADTTMVVVDDSRKAEPQGYSIIVQPVRPNPVPDSSIPSDIKRIRVVSFGYGPRGAVKSIRIEINNPVVDLNVPGGIFLNGKKTNFNLTGDLKKDCALLDTRDYSFNPPKDGIAIVAYSGDSSLVKDAENDIKDLRKKCGDASAITGVGDPDVANANLLPNWTDNPFNSSTSTQDLINQLRGSADYIGPEPKSPFSLGSATDPKIVIIQGDIDLKKGESFTGGGILIVEGSINFPEGSMFIWDGLVLITGKEFKAQNGGGTVNGAIAIIPKDGDSSIHIADGFKLKYNSKLVNNAMSKANKIKPVSVISEY